MCSILSWFMSVDSNHLHSATNLCLDRVHLRPRSHCDSRPTVVPTTGECNGTGTERQGRSCLGTHPRPVVAEGMWRCTITAAATIMTLSQFDNMSLPSHRKLTAMGIASLVATGRPEVLDRLPTEICNLWIDVFGEIKEAQESGEECVSLCFKLSIRLKLTTLCLAFR